MKLSKSQMEKELILQNNWKSGSADDTRKLRELRSSVQFLAEDFSESVKKNFIETSKEVSRDFLSLSQQIPERRNLTQQLLEMVDDCCHLNENVERELIYESDLTQLNPETMASMIRQGSLMRQATIRIKTEKKKLCDQATINNQSLDKDQSTNDIGKHDSGLDVEWIRELPDELDDFLAECCNTDLVKEMTEKFEQKENQLAEKLMIELKPAMDKYLQGGPKATRKTVLLLIKLDKISQACDLFLKNQSASIKYLVKELKLIDNPFHYVQQLNRLVCNTLAETVQEFRKLFADYPLCFSVLILWASGEMKNYTSLFIRHIFQSGLNLKATARCIKLAFEGAEVLMQSSLDLKFELEMLFEPHIEKMLDETERLFIDAMKLRIAEDRWRPYNLRSKARLSQYISEMNELHLEISDFVFGKEDCRLSLTSQMCSFARAVVPLTYELCELRQSAEFIANAIDQMMFHIWEIELNYLKNIPDCVPKEIYADNLKFCVGRLLPLCEKIYTKSSSIKNFDLLKCLLEELASDLLPFYEPFYIPESKYEVLGEV
ncbi:Exocyst complex component 8 [Trichinella pseudospiralis]|uniref:Exocyst complex component 8 n=1 Tax=Trichinella pseudospiralis TaxID=6337 RepID=A0A0V0Y915_TRIPS|nr:Exocyst complex component 8 [Trichinella pseudospiralis]